MGCFPSCYQLGFGAVNILGFDFKHQVHIQQYVGEDDRFGEVKDQKGHSGMKKAATIAHIHLNAMTRLSNNEV